MALKPLLEVIPITPDTTLDLRFFVSLMTEINSRISELQILKGGLEEAISAAQTVAVDRIDEVLGPAQDSLAEGIAATDAALITLGEAITAADDALTALQAGEFATSQVTGLDTTLAALQARHAVSFLSAATTVADGATVAADVSGGAWTLTLPAAPTAGATVKASVIVGDATANNLTIAGNGETIQGDASLVMDVAFASVLLIYNGTEWRIS